ncbi:MAG TPA: hypothetical protein VIQ50_13265 [Xanthobacteraceae bacterium]
MKRREFITLLGAAVAWPLDIGTIGLEWQYAGIAPVHAPGASDFVLRNVNSGAFEIYDVAGKHVHAGPLCPESDQRANTSPSG